MKVHLVPTVEEFALMVERLYGPDAVLHPANRITACGHRMGNLSVTTRVGGITCKKCLQGLS